MVQNLGLWGKWTLMLEFGDGWFQSPLTRPQGLSILVKSSSDVHLWMSVDEISIEIGRRSLEDFSPQGWWDFPFLEGLG